ncbi:hypothetical protein [Photobacterium nomapromontoriensis]|uniref:hypothetical protein n=1 Tax=Photobacterium nomapromontoriensis TaxID=2910237 RepID=UPI003D0F786C
MQLFDDMRLCNLGGIAQFIEGPLKDIDPDLYFEIRHSSQYAVFLGVIHESPLITTFLNYFNRIFSTIPPNFYTYNAGAGGTYILLEVLLAIAVGLFTGGTAAAARLAAFTARLTNTMANFAVQNTDFKMHQKP